MRTTSALSRSLATPLSISSAMLSPPARSGAGLAVDDRAGDGDDADRAIVRAGIDLAQVILELDLLVGDRAIVILAAKFGEAAFEGVALAGAVDELVGGGGAGEIAARGADHRHRVAGGSWRPRRRRRDGRG